VILENPEVGHFPACSSSHYDCCFACGLVVCVEEGLHTRLPADVILDAETMQLLRGARAAEFQLD
jgi:hypothetical protein